jgi:hypothetical protein
MTYQIFLPVVNSTYDTANHSLKGVALTHPFLNDLKSLNASWYYNWSLSGNNTDQFIPMCWGGKETPIQTQGYCLFLNEPESRVQANKTPEQALELLKILKDKRPLLRLIVGGCGFFGYDWMLKFRDLIAKNNIQVSGFHFHGYIESTITLDYIQQFWVNLKAELYGELWLTEFADTFGTQLPKMLEVVKSLGLTRYAYFTNRVKGNEDNQSFPPNWTKPEQISLVNWDGNLTSRGQIYEDFIV